MAKDQVLRLRVSEDFKEMAKQAADQEERTLSDYVYLLIKRDLEKKEIITKK